ncbi:MULTISPECIES: hypothetical protein [Falsihalocynthiibacter]|uniref:hypothetical protein n=1 Tax=Falsihalocynthiibacter TaxID=2854182 RepID=UPI0030018AD0
MTATSQRRLAIIAAVAFVGIFIAANAHFISVAFLSQPDCTLSAAPAAKPAC